MTTEEQPRPVRKSRMVRGIVRLRWIMLYMVTFGAIIWWYEFRPGPAALSRMQGTWQFVKGEIPNELPEDAFLEVRGRESWLVGEQRSALESKERVLHRNRVEVRPAKNFFIVRRSFGFDFGRRTPIETEYVVCLKEGELYMIHGLAPLDTVIARKVRKLRSVDRLPDDANAAIETYLKRLAE